MTSWRSWCQGLFAGGIMTIGLAATGTATAERAYALQARPMIPRECGMSAGSAYYGMLSVGSNVLLGAHTPWAGDVNWSPEMGRYVGMQGTITRMDGVDTVGCPGVRVTTDGGQYFWRIRDMQLASYAPPIPVPTPVPPPQPSYDPIPRMCGMPSGRESYGGVTVGFQVRVGRHSPWNGDPNWSPQMEPFVGAVGVVTRLDGVDSQGCPGVRVNVDGGQYFWRLRDMQAMGGAPVYIPPTPLPTPPPPVQQDPIPRWCGMLAGQENYGFLRPGSMISLGMHTTDVPTGDANWNPAMGRFVGSVAQVTQLAGVDSAGCPTVRVSVDGGQYSWRIRNAQLVR